MQNLITDIPGVYVGNIADEHIISGTTVVLVERPNVASGVIRGGAPGLRETAVLAPEMTVEGIDAVVLSGGSAFGLDAAGGTMSWLRDRDIGLQVREATVPIVVQAIVFDLLNGGDKSWGRMSPYWEMGFEAAARARNEPFSLGTFGGGYGATTANYKGGLGSASAQTESGFLVGAIVVVNALGAATIGDGPHFWAAPYEVGDEYGARGLPGEITAEMRRPRMKGGQQTATTIALVATDAALTKSQAKRLAHMADDGMARALRPVHAPMDGDCVFTVSTARKSLPVDPHMLTELGTVAADCLARAIARAVYEATVPIARTAWAGPPAYRDVFP